VQTAQYSANGINNATKYNVNQGIMQLINNFKTIFKDRDRIVSLRILIKHTVVKLLTRKSINSIVSI